MLWYVVTLIPMHHDSPVHVFCLTGGVPGGRSSAHQPRRGIASPRSQRTEGIAIEEVRHVLIGCPARDAGQWQRA